MTYRLTYPTHDVLVIGAGLSGLAFASVYLDVHPEANLELLEKEEVLGGTWNRRRTYDHLWTQWSVGFGEFSDKPMATPPQEDMYYGFFKSEHTTAYLEAYAEDRVIGGRSLKDRIQFSSTVTNVRKGIHGWHVDTMKTNISQPLTYVTYKLVIASGITTTPRLPHISGSDTFSGPIIHNVDFGSSQILNDKHVKHVTILGGGKSSADMIYACWKAGKKITWIVRPSGTGPLTLVSPKGKGPYRNAFELASTRASEAVQPSCLETKNLWNSFLHRSRLGMALSRKIWSKMDAEILAEADYAGRSSYEGFSKMVPHTSIFWRNNAVGLLNHPDFYDIFAKHVQICYDDLDSLNGRKVRMKGGENFESDALLLGTGWRSSLDYMSFSLKASLGLPYPVNVYLNKNEATLSQRWDILEHDADGDIIASFPALADPPEHVRANMDDAPFRLYNLVVPCDDDLQSIACIGQISTTNYFRTGEVQALWVTAYFDKKLTLPTLEERQDQVAHFVAWNRRRYLSSGDPGNSVVFDTFRYTDRLLKELGLQSHLKGLFANIFSPNRARDYSKLRDEYISKYGRGGL